MTYRYTCIHMYVLDPIYIVQYIHLDLVEEDPALLDVLPKHSAA